MIKQKKAITLIALIITIIILLILAGITLNLTIGQNGIITKAMQAGIDYSEQEAREKLELVLFDIQMDKQINKQYDEEYLIQKLEQNGMRINNNIVIVDGWSFEIDKSIPKIQLTIGKKEINIISIPYIGTTSFTIKLEQIINEDQVESYSYIINGEEIVTNSDKEYTIEELEAEANCIAQVNVKYKNGNIIESNQIAIKLEPKVYLYKQGENSDFWMNTLRIENFNKGKLTYIDPIKNTDNIVLNLVGSQAFQYTTINTKNAVDLTNYKSVNIDYEILSDCYRIGFGLVDDLYITDVLQDQDTSDNGRIEIPRWIQVGKYSDSIDLKNTNISNKYKYIYCYSAVGVIGDKRGQMKINSIWLEK